MSKGVKYDGIDGESEQKLRWDLLPLDVIERVVEIYTYGARKYSENSWQGVGKERYYAALMRHLAEYRKGEKYDKESGKSHLAHAVWNCIALLWNEMRQEQAEEDRQIKQEAK